MIGLKRKREKEKKKNGISFDNANGEENNRFLHRGSTVNMVDGLEVWIFCS